MTLYIIHKVNVRKITNFKVNGKSLIFDLSAKIAAFRCEKQHKDVGIDLYSRDGDGTSEMYGGTHLVHFRSRLQQPFALNARSCVLREPRCESSNKSSRFQLMPRYRLWVGCSASAGRQNVVDAEISSVRDGSWRTAAPHQRAGLLWMMPRTQCFRFKEISLFYRKLSEFCFLLLIEFRYLLCYD